jgi:hypothetical protein
MSVKVSRSFRFDKKLDDKLTALMAQENRNRNNLVEVLLEEALLARLKVSGHARSKRKQDIR